MHQYIVLPHLLNITQTWYMKLLIRSRTDLSTAGPVKSRHCMQFGALALLCEIRGQLDHTHTPQLCLFLWTKKQQGGKLCPCTDGMTEQSVSDNISLESFVRP